MASSKRTRYQVVTDINSSAEISELEQRKGAVVYDSSTDTIKFSDGQIFKSIGEIANETIGWGAYNDTQYTESSRFSLSANTDTLLPNNKGSVIESQIPTDYTTLYGDNVIKGQNGDGLLITLDFVAVPTSGSATYLETWFDIGGSVGELYRRPVSFPKGSGQVRQVVTTTAVYTLDTWEQNGASVYVRSNGDVTIYDVRYIIHRIHKAI